jgi:hypothetical protein
MNRKPPCPPWTPCDDSAISETDSVPPSAKQQRALRGQPFIDDFPRRSVRFFQTSIGIIPIRAFLLNQRHTKQVNVLL